MQQDIQTVIVGQKRVGVHVEDIGNPTKVICPECKDSALVVQEQSIGTSGIMELYLECANEDCGSCYYPPTRL